LQNSKIRNVQCGAYLASLGINLIQKDPDKKVQAMGGWTIFVGTVTKPHFCDDDPTDFRQWPVLEFPGIFATANE